VPEKALLLLKRLLALNPANRPSAEEALNDDYFWDAAITDNEELRKR
jgi:serine/threonine protein kinase